MSAICYKCRNVPTEPNTLLTFEDADGEEYDVCQRCEDFEREFGEADEATQVHMSTSGYGDWFDQWYAKNSLASKVIGNAVCPDLATAIARTLPGVNE